MPLPRIAVSLGDPAGIGPELALKAALSAELRACCVPVLVGDPAALALHAAACGLAPRIIAVTPAEVRGMHLPADAVALIARPRLAAGDLRLGRSDAACGRATLDAAAIAINAALAGQLDAVVAAPMTEKSVRLAGVEIDSYTTFVAAVTGVPFDHAYLMLCRDERRVVHLTRHTDAGPALRMITPVRVEGAIRAAELALRRMGVQAPRIAVAALSARTGVDGPESVVDATIIGPAIARARAAGMRVTGPHASDTWFGLPDIDVHVAMLCPPQRDAQHAPAAERAVAMTIGTPVLFATVAHGSALDLAGRNQGRPEALMETFRLLARMVPIAT